MPYSSPVTSWVKQPTAARGLDQLGSQAPCINLYGRLLPGITNVSDRARYYSFYPWFLWAYEQQYNVLVLEEIVERFRRADCLFTLIAEYHEQKTDKDHNRHGVATVGRDTLVEPLKNLKNGQYLKLSTYTTRETDNKNRYFKNKFGGLGQYYRGTLVELGLLDITNANKVIKYTLERGEIIARSFDAGVYRDLFFKTIENDRVDHKTLEQLQRFCPCFLSQNDNELTALLDLFFDRKNIYGDEGRQRRNTLCLILHFIQSLDDHGFDFNQLSFRASSYTGHLPKGILWHIPDCLKSTQALWGIYQRNELLSIAVQGLFWTTLETLRQMDPKPYTSSEFVSHWENSETFKKTVKEIGGKNFVESVSYIRSKMPALHDWKNQNHEIALAHSLPSITKMKNKNEAHTSMVIKAITVILSLAARDDSNFSPYASLDYPEGYFSYYPINLLTFQKHINTSWADLSLSDLIKWLTQRWGFDTHLEVALRKLRRDHRNTFRFYPSDKGLKVVGVPEPVFTNPRFKQGVQIMRDLHLIVPKKNGAAFELTETGKKILENAIEK